MNFQALLRPAEGLTTTPGLQSHCNQQPAYSGPVAGEKREFPAPAPERDDPFATVDPIVLSLASAVPVPAGPSEPSTPAAMVAVPGAGALDAVLATEVLQRVAWGGDRRRGVARLELGGELAGTVVVVRGEGREVTLEVTLPPNRASNDLPARLSARLEARGLVVRELVLR